MKSELQFLGGTPMRDGYGDTVLLFLPLIASQHGVCWDLRLRHGTEELEGTRVSGRI